MALAHNTRIVRSGLSLCLDAANRKSYPGSGAIWTDLSGNSNNGVLVNSPTFNNTNGGIIVFDGTDDYGYVVETSSIKPLNQLSVSMFCFSKKTSYTSCRILGDWHQNGLYDRWIFVAAGSSISWYMTTTTVGEGGTTGWPIIANQWVHLTGVYTGSSQDLYVNGVLFAQRANAGVLRGSDGNRPIRFGRQGDYAGTTSTGDFFDGNISSILFYNRALTAAEVSQNFEALRDRYGI